MSLVTKAGRNNHRCAKKCSHCRMAYFSNGIDFPARRIFNSGTRLKHRSIERSSSEIDIILTCIISSLHRLFVDDFVRKDISPIDNNTLLYSNYFHSIAYSPSSRLVPIDCPFYKFECFRSKEHGILLTHNNIRFPNKRSRNS